MQPNSELTVSRPRPEGLFLPLSPRPLSRSAGLVAAAVLLAATTATARAETAQARLFARVFGDAVQLDPAIVAKVKALKPGQQYFVDRDGKHVECWFIDNSLRHSKKVQPLLVRAIDEDGDMTRDGGPDLDSDLYVADWGADGNVDAVIDYQDDDHDNDVDEMGIFYFSAHDKGMGGRDALRVWWGRDDGDDNQLWFDVNYTYIQGECQWRSHFSGDETFVAFGLADGDERWLPMWENPFLFYDPDRDTCSELAIRIGGLGDTVQNLRFSIDADDDAFGRRTHDYDFSVTAIAVPPSITRPASGPAIAKEGSQDSKIKLPADMAESTKIRGIPTGPFLKRVDAVRFATTAAWSGAMLAWDEINSNTSADFQHEPQERWEGLIAPGNEEFPQVGGPACSPLNKRFEVSMRPVKPLRLYYDNTDHRLHLVGAHRGWINVDYDLDGRIDGSYVYTDTNGDGYFDRRQIDLDGDSKPDLEFPMAASGRREVALDFGEVRGAYLPELDEVLAASQVFVDAARPVLAAQTGAVAGDPVEAFFLDKLPQWAPAAGLGAHIRSTPAGARFYMDFVRDRLFFALRQKLGQTPAWAGVETLYARGNYRTAAEQLAREFPAAQPNPAAFGGFPRRIPLRLDNAGGPQRDNWPIFIPTRNLVKIAPDFNAQNAAVVAADRWIGWRQIPHQVDAVDPQAGPELSFEVDLRANTSPVYYLYYSPTGQTNAAFPPMTATAEDWVPPNIGWESDRGAYRSYWGQFDFFGKKLPTLIYPTIGRQSYHSEEDWGMDCLNVKVSSGLGGLTLYMGEESYPVQNPAGKGQIDFTKRQVAAGPVRAAVEILAKNVVPGRPDLSIRMTPIIYAHRNETEVRVQVVNAVGEVELAPGFIKLPLRESAFVAPEEGYAGVWGQQVPEIGEIAMGLIAPPKAYAGPVDLPTERRYRWRTSEGGQLRYWLWGDWRRGRQYPVAPAVENWRRELRELAAALLHDVVVTPGPVETLQ